MPHLDITNHSAQKFNLGIADVVDEISQPLTNYIGITHFGHIKIFNDGTMLRLANNREWTQKYFEKAYYNDVDLYETKDLPINGRHSLLLTGNPSTDHLKALCYDYNIWNALIIYKKFATHTDLWFFGTRRENTEILNHYMNNLDLFERFILYFKDSMSDILDKYDPEKLIVSKIKNADFINAQNDSIKRFLEETKIKSYHLKDNIYLPHREIECLFHLAKGKTMKEVARRMDISPRTVEFYINSMKKKTRAHTKSHLIKIFNEVPNYLSNINYAL